MPERRILPMLEREVGLTMHNKVVGDLTTQIMRALPTVPDRMVLMASVLAGVIHYSNKQEPVSTEVMMEIVISEAETILKRLEGKKK